MMSDFPIDEVTLDFIYGAVNPEPWDERSSLYDTLELLSDMHFPERDHEGLPVRWTQNDVISTLIDEIRRLRNE